MRKSLLSVVAVVGLSVAAVAVGHIPTRYSGSFPSDGIRKDITGTFTGKTLSLRFTRTNNKGTFRRSFAGSCKATSATQTACSGTIRGTGGDQVDAGAVVTVTWGAGKPVATAFSK